jgi:hypothetical protein
MEECRIYDKHGKLVEVYTKAFLSKKHWLDFEKGFRGPIAIRKNKSDLNRIEQARLKGEDEDIKVQPKD